MKTIISLITTMGLFVSVIALFIFSLRLLIDKNSDDEKGKIFHCIIISIVMALFCLGTCVGVTSSGHH